MTPPADGAPVYYWGSLDELHGLAVYRGACRHDGQLHAGHHVLETDDGYHRYRLDCVRQESFKVL